MYQGHKSQKEPWNFWLLDKFWYASKKSIQQKFFYGICGFLLLMAYNQNRAWRAGLTMISDVSPLSRQLLRKTGGRSERELLELVLRRPKNKTLPLWCCFFGKSEGRINTCPVISTILLEAVFVLMLPLIWWSITLQSGWCRNLSHNLQGQYRGQISYIIFTPKTN